MIPRRFLAHLMAFVVVAFYCTSALAVPGDYNADGTVNAADFIVYRKNLGSTNYIPNDDTPYWVMEDDYDVWRMYFGMTEAGSGTSSSVPEPTGLMLIISSSVVFVVCKRRRFMNSRHWSR
jgi:hypothetical protein